MSRTVSIVVQVLGCQALLAMITTIRIPDILVFDPPFAGRAVLGVLGLLLILAGSLSHRTHTATEKRD